MVSKKWTCQCSLRSLAEVAAAAPAKALWNADAEAAPVHRLWFPLNKKEETKHWGGISSVDGWYVPLNKNRNRTLGIISSILCISSAEQPHTEDMATCRCLELHLLPSFIRSLTWLRGRCCAGKGGWWGPRAPTLPTTTNLDPPVERVE